MDDVLPEDEVLIVDVLIGFNERNQYIQAITFRKIRFSAHQSFDFLERGLVICLRFDRANFHRPSQTVCVSLKNLPA